MDKIICVGKLSLTSSLKLSILVLGISSHRAAKQTDAKHWGHLSSCKELDSIWNVVISATDERLIKRLSVDKCRKCPDSRDVS